MLRRNGCGTFPRADQAVSNESLLVETERLSDALDVRDVDLANVRRSFDAQGIELDSARLQLDAVTTQLEQAAAEQEELLKEEEQLQATLGDQRDALAATQAENAELGRILREHETSLARTREEALRLALALAEDEEALARQSAELHERDEQLRVAKSELAARDELLARLDAIGRSRSRRWRSFTQFCSWLFPPTTRHLGYIRTYLHLRRSDLFDADYYLSRYPDVSHAGLNPLMHYVEHGHREGRQARGSLELSFLEPSPPSSVESPTLTPPLAPELVPEEAERPPEDVAPEEAFAAELGNALAEHVPETAVIAVATGGEQHLASLREYRTLHFPRGSDGTHGGNDAMGDTCADRQPRGDPRRRCRFPVGAGEPAVVT